MIYTYYYLLGERKYIKCKIKSSLGAQLYAIADANIKIENLSGDEIINEPALIDQNTKEISFLWQPTIVGKYLVSIGYDIGQSHYEDKMYVNVLI